MIEVGGPRMPRIIPMMLILAVLSSSAVPACAASAHTITADGERLEFTPRPDLGYVVKQAKPSAQIGALAGALFLEAGTVTEIRGLDRKGLYVAENDGLASQNVAVMTALAADGTAEYVAPLYSINGETVAIIPEIVVRLREGATQQDLAAVCQSMRLQIKKRMEFSEVEYLLEVLGMAADAVFDAVEQSNEVPFVEWAYPNTAGRPKLCGQLIPDDEYFPMQWHLHNTGQSGGTPGADINAPGAWQVTVGDPNVIVAVVDTGVDLDHPDLVNSLVPGYDFLDDDDLPDPALDHSGNTHGTACAGLVAAQGNSSAGVTGVTWNCKVMPIRITAVEGDGTEHSITEQDIAGAFRWAAAHGADVLSNSWASGNNPTPIIQSAIRDITDPGGLGRDGKGCVILFGAGNRGGALRWYPQKYPEVIAVGATDHNDLRCYYSDYGPELDVVASSAPGYSWADWLRTKREAWLWTTDITGSVGWNAYGSDPSISDYTDRMGGASGACPIAAGVAALVLSVEPNLTNEEVRHYLEWSAKDLGDPGWDEYYGWGRVDARAALDMVLAKRADLNDDRIVNWQDFAVLAQSYKTTESLADIGPAPRPDGTVDIQDVILLGQYWMEEIPEFGLIDDVRIYNRVIQP